MKLFFKPALTAKLMPEKDLSRDLNQNRESGLSKARPI
jgi:hypothetical protein